MKGKVENKKKQKNIYGARAVVQASTKPRRDILKVVFIAFGSY